MQWSVRSDQNGSTLVHYGVKGMKWGVRKEYEPKGRSSAQKSPVQASKIEAAKNKKGLDKIIETEKGRTEIHINGKDDYDRYRSEIPLYRDWSPGDYFPESVALKKFRELPRIDESHNAAYERFAINNDGPTYERRMNCFECSITYEMRKRGYDVQANERMGGFNHEILHAFNVKDSFTVSSSSNDEAYNRVAGQCLAYGDGARGTVLMYWPTGGGHAINWEVKNGKFILLDNQQSEVSGDDSFANCDPTNIEIWRLDNAEVLPGVTDFVEPHEQPKDTMAPVKPTWEVKKKSVTTDKKQTGKKTVDKILREFGNNAAKFVSNGMAAIAKFFKNPLNIQRKSDKSSSTKKKDSRSFIEKLFNIQTKSETKTGNGEFTRHR